MRRAVIVVLSSLSLSACGAAAGERYEPPLVSFNGTIVSSTVATPTTVRVALVWMVPEKAGESSSFRAAQELAVRAEFPATFHLDVRTLPPPEVITPIDPEVRGTATAYAFGTLVVYEDTNGNGKLDLAPKGATKPVDRVLGAPERLEIIYLEGGGVPKNPSAPATDEDSVEHSAGFNLVLEPELSEPEPGCSSCGPEPVSGWTRLASDASLTIALTAEPSLSRAICKEVSGGGVSSSSECQPCVGDGCARCPISKDARVTCSADKSAFVVLSCESASLCAENDCAYVSGRLDPSGRVPADWPCR